MPSTHLNPSPNSNFLVTLHLRSWPIPRRNTGYTYTLYLKCGRTTHHRDTRASPNFLFTRMALFRTMCWVGSSAVLG